MHSKRTPNLNINHIHLQPHFALTPSSLLPGHFIGVTEVEMIHRYSYQGSDYLPITSPVFLIEKVGTLYLPEEGKTVFLLVLAGTDRERIELWLDEDTSRELRISMSKSRYYGGWGHKLWREVIREKINAILGIPAGRPSPKGK